MALDVRQSKHARIVLIANMELLQTIENNNHIQETVENDERASHYHWLYSMQVPEVFQYNESPCQRRT